MIDRLAKEIDIAIKNKLYLVALNTALTLPDICGKAEYPELDSNKATKKRYVDWCNKYIEDLTQININKTIPSLTANVIYSLRCSLSHQGNPNVDKNTGIDRFTLTIQKNDFGLYFDIPSQVTHANGITENCYSINIARLCYMLSDAAQKYYKKNRLKFKFFNYSIQDVDKEFDKIKHLIFPFFKQNK